MNLQHMTCDYSLVFLPKKTKNEKDSPHSKDSVPTQFSWAIFIPVYCTSPTYIGFGHCFGSKPCKSPP